MSGESSKGGFHFGDVGGDVSMNAGGDIVGGDKVTSGPTGFQSEDDRAEFVQQIDELRKSLRELKSHVESSDSLDEDARDELALEFMQQIKALGQAKSESETANLQTAHSENVVSAVGGTGDLFEKLKALGSSASDVMTAAGPVLAKAAPLLATARHWVGL